jgi:curved DNA-binding protein CbpA
MKVKTEKRHFKRYGGASDLALKIKDRTIQGKLLNYSLSGLRVSTEHSYLLQVGETVAVSLKSPQMNCEARIMWMEGNGPGLLLGLLLDRPIKGDLRHFQLADVLAGLYEGQETGILSIRKGDLRKNICIKNGEVVFAGSNLQTERLVDLLLKAGRLSREQYEACIHEFEPSGKKMGTILVERGFITPAELVQYLQYQVEEIIIGAFSLATGEFEFVRAPLTEEIINLRLSLADLIYKGIKRLEDPALVYSHEDLDKKSIIGFSRYPLHLFQRISLSEPDRKILSLVNGTRTVDEIVVYSPVSEAETLKTIYALLGTKIVETRSNPDGSPPVSAEKIVTAGAPGGDFRARIEEMGKKCKEGTYYEILGVDRNTGPDEIAEAYYRLSKEFHPDRHFYLNENCKSALNAIFCRIGIAHSILSNPEQKELYDMELDQMVLRNDEQNNPEIKYFKGGVFSLRSGKIKRAGEFFSKAIELNPNKAEYHYYYGITLLELLEFKKAFHAFSEAQRLDPSNPSVFSELGYLCLRFGFPKRAKNNFEKALSISPDMAKARDGLDQARKMLH